MQGGQLGRIFDEAIAFDPGVSGMTSTNVHDAIIEANSGGVTDHGALTGRSDDDHPNNFFILGRSGGTTAIGGVDGGDDLNLISTSHATLGIVNIDGVHWDKAGGVWDWASAGFGTLKIRHTGKTWIDLTVTGSGQTIMSVGTQIANAGNASHWRQNHSNAFVEFAGGGGGPAGGAIMRLYGRDHSAAARQGWFYISPSNHVNAAADGNSIVVIDLVNTNSRFEIRDANTRRFFVDKAGSLQFDGDLIHNGSNIGFNGATPVAQSSGWAVTNHNSDKVFDADATTVDELSDVLGTLITYLILRGDLSA